MGQPQEKPTVEQVLKLVEQLTPEEREQILEEMKLQELQRALTRAEESIARGEGIPGEDVIAELRKRAQERIGK